MHKIITTIVALLTNCFAHPKMELATVGDDYAQFFRRDKDGAIRVIKVEHLQPGRNYCIHGKHFRTLTRPSGRLLSTFATVNDVHIGESICGYDSHHPERGPVLRNDPEKLPYAEMMSRNAVQEISLLNPDAVIAKGDLTDSGKPEEFDRFKSIWGKFGDRLHWVCGNHDVHTRRPAGAPLTVRVDLPGVTLALLDTCREGKATGCISVKQIEWLDQVCKDANRPVMIFGHHHLWNPKQKRDANFFGINPDDSEKLVDLLHRQKCIVGYFAGHTHSNHVTYIAGLPDVPIVECGAVKEFPGAWEEYRVYENGIQQIMHRLSATDSLNWAEATSKLEEGQYERRHFGKLSDRCFTWKPRIIE